MVQELQVLKCCSCSTFQVHIVKKAKKWDCKICNQKQSIKEVFGKGSGKDCRVHAQKLNALRAERDGSNLTDDQFSAFLAALSHQTNNGAQHLATIQQSVSNFSNKWNKYLENDDQEDEILEEDNRHLLQGPIQPKRKKRKLCGDDDTSSVGNKVFEKSIDTLCSNPAEQVNSWEKPNTSLYGRQYSHNHSNDYCMPSDDNLRLKQNSIEKSEIKNKLAMNNTLQVSCIQSSILSGPYETNKSGFNLASNLIYTKNPSVSKWSKYLCTETNDISDDNQIEDFSDENICYNQEFSYNSPNVISESLEKCISPDKSPVTSNTTTQQFVNEPLVVHKEQEKCNGKLKLLQSLLELKNEIETTDDCAQTSGMTLNKNEEPNKTTKKIMFNMFEDDDLAWLDEVNDF